MSFRCIFLALIVALITPALVACGEDGDDDLSLSTPSGNQEPIKIGVLADWSGPIAKAGVIAEETVALIEKELASRGGILDGRPVRFVTVDGYGTIAETTAAVETAVRDDQVCALVGVTGGRLEAVRVVFEVAEVIGLPYFSVSPAFDDLARYPYSVRAAYPRGSTVLQTATGFVLGDLKPESVALLMDDTTAMRESLTRIRETLEGVGVEVVYEDYVDPTAADFSAHVNSVKQSQADLLIGAFISPSSYMALFRAVNDLGGWDNTDFLSLMVSSEYAVLLPAAQGTYHLMPWLSESPHPESRKFVQTFEDKYSRPPEVGDFLYYTALWTALHAVELAGSDNPEAIAQAARSGDLVWDSPAGPYRIGTDGEHTETLKVAVVEDGKLVFIDSD